jgi:release factor H-coupled RctB family protein
MYLLVHSGSRSYGESILRLFLDNHSGSQVKGTEVGSEEFKSYIEGHDMALNYASRNRFLIAHRILS